MAQNTTPPAPRPRKELTYIEKVWHTVAIVALLVVSILIARVAFNVLLMILAGSLIAVYFHGLGDMIERNTKWNRKVCMTISVAGSFIILGTLLWFMGTTIQGQIAALSDTLPETINNFKTKFGSTPLGAKVLEYFTQDDNSDKMMSTARSFFSTSFGVLGNIYIIMFLGIFFSTHPSLYKDGIVKLFPPQNKPMARKVINRTSQALKGWLKGMMLSMVLIFVMIASGLWIIGIPVALVLALLTALLKLIPNFGSLAAMIPGVLLALTKDLNTAIITALLYTISQTIVSNIVTPLIQKKMINIPPALTIISQVIMGVLSGVLGIILAVPLLSIIIILVDEIYVKKINPDEPDDDEVGVRTANAD
ncbi:AI-2E family transporter [Mucilaginibacter conchicola]|uniref:AI-2E family transporter n=1 Tax=Mucilaginibacter conchicola TaxID=2303333 RepID=A0A372NQD8_9SPHI|nr:AI-2E family transporter [Mucilaginibacter conchicola]RFZ90847.1 AI-2E family transporter [Mucilaginibacter conchicola]